MDVPTKIRAIMKKTGKNQGELAEAFNVSQPTVHRWLKGSEPEGHRRDEINALYDEVFGEGGVPVGVVKLVGYVGAGAEIMPDFEQVPPEGLDLIQVDIPVPDGMIAFKVRGESMRPQFRDGMLIIAYAEQRRATESFYGQEAIVRTGDGRRFVKTLEKGATGTNLVSWNAATIPNQRIVWIGEIYAILPESAVRSFSGQVRRIA